MCGIFGIISTSKINSTHFDVFTTHAQQRGKDSSGLFFYQKDNCKIEGNTM